MSPRVTARRVRSILSGFRRVRLVVVGDLVADEFIYGQVERVSREAPVLILRYDSTDVVPGGAGNAAMNVAALGGQVRVVGLAGRDEPGRRLVAALDAQPHASVRGVVQPAGYATPVKTRILAGGIHSAKQQVVRVDRPGTRPTPAAARAIAAALAREIRQVDALIVSDYGSGLITPALVSGVLDRHPPSRVALRRTRPIVVADSRYALLTFGGVTACTPNESEVEALLGVRIDDDPRALEEAGRELLRRMRCNAVLVTRGSRGMALFEAGRPTDHIPIVGSDQIADVTGAGDTVIATFTLALAAGATFGEAARLANYAGGLVVMKRGTATVTAAELRAAIRADHKSST
jgi:rfaE bifunctional protein kinase chain/domain